MIPGKRDVNDTYEQLSTWRFRTWWEEELWAEALWPALRKKFCYGGEEGGGGKRLNILRTVSRTEEGNIRLETKLFISLSLSNEKCY